MRRMDDVRAALAGGKGCYIFSLFPIAMKAERPYNGATSYILPASKGPNDVKSCKVANAFQHTYSGNGEWADVPVFYDEIARDLLQEWSGSLIGQDQGHGPGIWMQEDAEPMPEEVASAVARQTAYFEYLVTQADGLYKSGKATEITDLHRSAARWLGYESFAWLEKLVAKTLKECVACYTRIDGRATICPVCTTRQPSASAEQAPATLAAKAAKKELAELTK